MACLSVDCFRSPCLQTLLWEVGTQTLMIHQAPFSTIGFASTNRWLSNILLEPPILIASWEGEIYHKEIVHKGIWSREDGKRLLKPESEIQEMTSKHPFIYGTLQQVAKTWRSDGWVLNDIKPEEETQEISHNICGDIFQLLG